MTIEQLIADIRLRLASSNSVRVQRAHITADEFELIVAAIEKATP